MDRRKKSEDVFPPKENDFENDLYESTDEDIENQSNIDEAEEEYTEEDEDEIFDLINRKEELEEPIGVAISNFSYKINKTIGIDGYENNRIIYFEITNRKYKKAEPDFKVRIAIYDKKGRVSYTEEKFIFAFGGYLCDSFYIKECDWPESIGKIVIYPTLN